MRFVGWIGLFCFLLLGCAESHRLSTDCGEGGQLHAGEYGVACSYVVVVTGFECPSVMPYESQFEGGWVCSSEPFDPSELPSEICDAFRGKCAPVNFVDGGAPVDASVGCEQTADCAEGQYCKGTCDALGACTNIPENPVCTEAEIEYCTCDGTPSMHHNGCVWERYTPGDLSCFSSGGECLETADCPSGEYCQGDCSAPGTCTNIPENPVCTEAEIEYCTCDGTPSMHHNGCVWERYTPGDISCRNTNDDCGQSSDCATGYYCKGDCSAPGKCTEIPEEADCTDDLTTTCLCDGGAFHGSSTCVWDRYDPGDHSCMD